MNVSGRKIIFGKTLLSEFATLSGKIIKFTGKTDHFYCQEAKANLPLYLAPHNCGMSYEYRLVERSIELPIAKWWIEMIREEPYCEVGAVLPYYPKIFDGHEVIDPGDSHSAVSIKKSIFDTSLLHKNVLSISTIEHIGTGDYNLPIKETAKMGIRKIVCEAEKFLITVPLGYNSEMDDYIRTELSKNTHVHISIYERDIFTNRWNVKKKMKKKYLYGPWTANALCVIYCI